MKTDLLTYFPIRATFGGCYFFERTSEEWEVSDLHSFQFTAQKKANGLWQVDGNGALVEVDPECPGMMCVSRPIKTNLSQNGAEQLLFAFHEESARIAIYNRAANTQLHYYNRLPARLPYLSKKLEKGRYDFPAWRQKLRADPEAIKAFPIPHIVMTKQILDTSFKEIENMRDNLHHGDIIVDVDENNEGYNEDTDDDNDVVWKSKRIQEIDADILTQGLSESFGEEVIQAAVNLIYNPQQFIALYEPLAWETMDDYALMDAQNEKDNGLIFPGIRTAENREMRQDAWGLYYLEKGCKTKVMHLKYFSNVVQLCQNLEQHYLEESIRNDVFYNFIDNSYDFHWKNFKPFAKAYDVNIRNKNRLE